MFKTYLSIKERGIYGVEAELPPHIYRPLGKWFLFFNPLYPMLLLFPQEADGMLKTHICNNFCKHSIESSLPLHIYYLVGKCSFLLCTSGN